MTAKALGHELRSGDNTRVFSHDDVWQRTRMVVMGASGAPAAVATFLSLFIGGSEVSDDARMQILAILATLAFGAVILGWFLARQLIFPMMSKMTSRQQDIIDAIESFSSRLEGGDLKARVELTAQQKQAGGELGRLGEVLNRIMGQIAEAVQHIFTVTGKIDEASEAILRATNEQIANATDQDSSVMQTSSTVQEVRATVTETAERAAAVAEMAQKSVNVSKAGETAVAEAIGGMNLIRQRVESIADNILVLSEHTQQIGEIIATVSALADQSKLLALNASVEAARAGTEGKGFAVVAMEVRNLAEQSREATAQVRDILSEIQQATNSAVMVTEEGTKGVDVGVALVNRAGESIRELAGTIEEAAYSAIQIAASTRQQTVGMDQLMVAINNIRQATAQTTTATMSVERAARELNTISRQLGEVIGRYRIQ